MNTRDIVRKAWQMTQVHLKKLIWYGAIPAFFSIVVSSAYLIYQYNAFRHSSLFNEDAGDSMVGNIESIWHFITGHVGLSIALGIIGLLFFLGYVLLTPILRGALIEAVNRIHEYKAIDGSVEVGVRRFFPVFEFGLISGAFSITTLFTESSFILRWWGENVFFFALPILLFIAIIGFVVSFLFTYAEYYIVLHNQRLMKAIMNSVILVIANLRKTILVLILMLLIGARIILNVILVLLIPMFIIGSTTFLATVVWWKIGLAIAGVVGLALILVAAYLFGLFHVFAATVWVLTFNLLAEKSQTIIQDEDLGTIEEKKD